MKKILAVDDDHFILATVSTALEGAGYKVVMASNAHAALEIMEQESFDFLITDVLMPPGEDGTSLMRYAKEHYPEMRVLAMTGGLENAVDDYINYADLFSDKTLSKPFHRTDLLKAVETLNSL